MSKRTVIILAVIAVVAVGAAMVWYLASPLFIDETVDEAFPLEAPGEEELAQQPEEDPDEMEAESTAAAPGEAEQVEDGELQESEATAEETPASMPDETIEEDMPGELQPVEVGQGQFQDADAVHRGSGSATIYQLPEGGYVLRFEDLNVTNGPDLHVFLAASPSPTGQADLGEYLDLGLLKGNVGNQNYEIPEGTDLAQFGSIVIYCVPFHVVFSVASLG